MTSLRKRGRKRKDASNEGQLSFFLDSFWFRSKKEGFERRNSPKSSTSRSERHRILSVDQERGKVRDEVAKHGESRGDAVSRERNAKERTRREKSVKRVFFLLLLLLPLRFPSFQAQNQPNQLTKKPQPVHSPANSSRTLKTDSPPNFSSHDDDDDCCCSCCWEGLDLKRPRVEGRRPRG